MTLRTILLVLFCFLGFMSAECLAKSTFHVSQLVTFGDSLSDNGNLYQKTLAYHQANPRMHVIPEDPYYRGRFCNGPVWVEYLAESLHLNTKHRNAVRNYAYGGSWVEPAELSHHLFPPSLRKQVDSYLAEIRPDEDLSHVLYSFWHGANDLLVNRNDIRQVTTDMVSMIHAQMERLIKHGARHFVVVNMPDLGTVPFNLQIRTTLVSEQSAASSMYNQKLTRMLAQLKELYPVDIAEVDIFTPIQIVSTENTYRGEYFRKSRFPCYKGRAALIHIESNELENPASVLLEHVCRDPDNYVFWDWIHPSTKVQKLVGLDAMSALIAEGLVVE